MLCTQTINFQIHFSNTNYHQQMCINFINTKKLINIT